MKVPSREKEFSDVEWQQGRLLDTKHNRSWPGHMRKRADAEERLKAFAFFVADNEGRGRQFVCMYDTPEECAAAVQAHNESLKAAKAANAIELRGEPRSGESSD